MPKKKSIIDTEELENSSEKAIPHDWYFSKLAPDIDSDVGTVKKKKPVKKKSLKKLTQKQVEMKRISNLQEMTTSVFSEMKRHMPTMKAFLTQIDPKTRKQYIVQVILSLPVSSIRIEPQFNGVVIDSNWKSKNRKDFNPKNKENEKDNKLNNKLDFKQMHKDKSEYFNPILYKKAIDKEVYNARSLIYLPRVRRFSMYEFGFEILTDNFLGFYGIKPVFNKKLSEDMNVYLNAGSYIELPENMLDFKSLRYFWSTSDQGAISDEDFDSVVMKMSNRGEISDVQDFGQRKNEFLVLD